MVGFSSIRSSGFTCCSYTYRKYIEVSGFVRVLSCKAISIVRKDPKSKHRVSDYGSDTCPSLRTSTKASRARLCAVRTNPLPATCRILSGFLGFMAFNRGDQIVHRFLCRILSCFVSNSAIFLLSDRFTTPNPPEKDHQRLELRPDVPSNSILCFVLQVQRP